MCAFRKSLDALIGTNMSQWNHQRQLDVCNDVHHCFNFLKSLAPPPSTLKYSPLFILSAGWRSGSTLLQRLIISAKGVVIWGNLLINQIL